MIVNQRHNRANIVRNDFRHHHPRHDFWRSNPYWARWRFTRPYRWATWGGLTGWFIWGGWPNYYAFDYCEGGNVVIEGDYVYVDGEQYATTVEYADQAIAIADAGAEQIEQATQSGEEIEWMSLGVFALVDEEKGEPTMFFQLAVSKDGTIAGTYNNTSTEQSIPVQGSVDKETQRAAWSVGDKKNTVVETGIYNLTQDEAPAVLHFGNERQQTWLLVRLEDAEAGSDE